MKFYIIKLQGTNTDPGSTTYGQPEVRTGIVEAPSFSDAVHRATLIWEHTHFVIDSAYLINVVDRILYWEDGIVVRVEGNNLLGDQTE